MSELPVGPAVPRKAEVKTTRRAGAVRKARPDTPPPRWLVWAEASELDEAQRRSLAKAAGLDPEVVEQLAQRSLPVPVHGAADEGSARAWAARLDLPLQVSETRPMAPVGALAGAALLTVLAVVFTALLPPLGLAIWVGVAALAFFGVFRPLRARRHRAQALGVALAALPDPDQRAGGLLQRARELRSQLLQAGLAEVIRLDLDAQLQELVWTLEELEPAETEARRALAEGVDDPAVQDRLDELDARCEEAEQRMRRVRATMAQHR